MNKLEQYLNFAFEIYGHDGKMIDKIKGPGDLGDWIGSPYSASELAIIPFPFQKLTGEIYLENLYRVVRIPLDEKKNELGKGKEEMILYEAESEQEAKRFARELGCEYMYWSAWDEARYIVIVNVSSDDSYTESDDAFFYSCPID